MKKKLEESLPERGAHFDACACVFPSCICNQCKRDFSDIGDSCCMSHGWHKRKYGCPTESCKDFVKDEPKKKEKKSNEA